MKKLLSLILVICLVLGVVPLSFSEGGLAEKTIDDLFIVNIPENLEYDGSSKTVTVTPKSGVTGTGTVTITYDYDNGSIVGPVKPGTYSFSISMAAGEKYAAISSAVNDSWTFTITPKTVTLTTKDQTILKGENIESGTEQVELTGAVSGHTLSGVTLEANSDNMIIPTEFGITDGSNDVTHCYKINHQWGTLTIKTPTIADLFVVTPPSNTVFDGDEKNVTVTAKKGGVGEVYVSYDGFEEYTYPVKPGTYSPVITMYAGGVYGEIAETRDSSWAFTITPMPLTVTGLTVTKVYDGTTGTTTAQVSGTASLTGDGGILSDYQAELSGTPTMTFADANVGDEKQITLSGYSLTGDYANCYTLGTAGNQNNDFKGKITQKAVTVTAKEQTIASGGTITEGAEQAELTDALSGHTLSAVTLTANADAGTITPSAATIVDAEGNNVTGNYAINYQPGTLTFKTDATIADLFDVTLPTNLSFDGSVKTVTVTPKSGITGTGTVTISYESENGTTDSPVVPGTYSPVISMAEGEDYSAIAGKTDSSWQFTIAPRELTVTGLTGTTKEYDGTTAAEVSGTAELTGIVTDYPVELSGTPTAAFADADVGTEKAITLSGYTLTGTAAACYTLGAISDIKGTITAKTVTVTANAQKIASGGTIDTEAGQAVLEGALNGHTLSSVKLTANADAGTITPGDATIVDAEGNNVTGNYAINYQPGTLTFKTDATIADLFDVTLPTNLTFDGSVKTVAVTPKSGITGYGTVAISYKSENGTTDSPVVPGTYSPVISMAEGEDYSAIAGTTDSSWEFTITPRELTVTGLTGTTKEYDGTTTAEVSGTAALTGIVTDYPVELSGTPTAAFADAGAGTEKAITLSGYTLTGEYAGCYTLGNADAQTNDIQGTITKKAVTVKAQNQTIASGGTITEGVEQAVLTGALEGHSLSSVTLEANAEAGTITPTAATIVDAEDNNVTGNYEIDCVAGTLTVGNPYNATVIFKVKNGSWNGAEGDKAKTDISVSLSGVEAVALTSNDIPAVGDAPGDGYQEGEWDVIPVAGTTFENGSETIYTYTYKQRSNTVIFKVVHGAWDERNGSTADIVIPLVEENGMAEDLPKDQIPKAGNNPDTGYKAGRWNPQPTGLLAGKTFTYTYIPSNYNSYLVTFKVEHGSWDNKNTAPITTYVEGPNSQDLVLDADQIPEVGDEPANYYEAGSWSPALNTVITQDTSFTYSYAEKAKKSYNVTFQVVNGSWDNKTGNDAASDITVSLQGYVDKTLKLTAEQIPQAGHNPKESYAAGSWNAEPSPDTEITEDTTYIYTYRAPISAKITFKVENGYWDDKTGDEAKADIIVSLTGWEDDTLQLTDHLIPKVGQTPETGYKAGMWDPNPSLNSVFADKFEATYIYKYVETDVFVPIWEVDPSSAVWAPDYSNVQVKKTLTNTPPDGMEIETEDWITSKDIKTVRKPATACGKYSEIIHTATFTDLMDPAINNRFTVSSTEYGTKLTHKWYVFHVHSTGGSFDTAPTEAILDVICENFQNEKESLKATITVESSNETQKTYKYTAETSDKQEITATETFYSSHNEHNWNVEFIWKTETKETGGTIVTATAAATCRTGKEKEELPVRLTSRTSRDKWIEYTAKAKDPDGKLLTSVKYLDPESGKLSDLPAGVASYEGSDIVIYGVEETYGFTGKRIKPAIRVFDGDTELAQSTDYTVSYTGKNKIGEINKVEVKGKGNYAGKSAMATFTIVDPRADIPEADQAGSVSKVKLSEKKFTYDGTAHYPSTITVTLKDKSEIVYTYDEIVGCYTTNSEKKVGLSVANNVNKGTATVSAIGSDGKVKRAAFKIEAMEIADAVFTIEAVDWAVKAATPKITAVLNGMELVAGQDYKVSFRAKEAGEGKGVAKISGKGNFKGKHADVTYSVNHLELTEDNIFINAIINAKAKVSVVDGAGNTVNSKTYSYTIQDEDGKGKGIKEKLPAGEYSFIVNVTDKGKNQMTADDGVTVNVTLGQSIKKVKVKVDKNFFKTYTGEPITLDASDFGPGKIVVGELKYGTDFEIVGYKNNVKKGTMTVTVQGIGTYSGTKTFKVKIKAKSLDQK